MSLRDLDTGHRSLRNKKMRRQYKRAAALIVLSCILTLTGNGRGFSSIRAYAEKTYTETVYDEMVFWGDAAAYLYYFAENSGYSTDSILYYYSEKDSQEDIVKAQFEKMALYSLISCFPEKDAVTEKQGYVYVNKDVMDVAASELYGIDMKGAVDYCSFFTEDGDDYVFMKPDFGSSVPESVSHAFYGDVLNGYVCLTKNGTWVEPYEFDMYMEPVENGRYSNYRFSSMTIMTPDSYKKISTGEAEEEMVSVRLMAFLNHEPANAFLSHDFTGTESENGIITYECEDKFLTQEDMTAYLCPKGDDTERIRVGLGSIFKNGNHYIADYGEGLLEVKMTEDRELIFMRNKRYKK